MPRLYILGVECQIRIFLSVQGNTLVIHGSTVSPKPNRDLVSTLLVAYLLFQFGNDFHVGQTFQSAHDTSALPNGFNVAGAKVPNSGNSMYLLSGKSPFYGAEIFPVKGNIRLDKIVTLNSLNSACDRKCKKELRVVRVWVEEKQQELEFITNNLTLAASTIAAIYKERWQIELFFKDLKQNLKIKTFVGTSYNAVQIQLWTALICILLLKYLKFRSSCDWHLSNLVALLRLNLFSYRDLWRWINDPYQTPPQRPPTQQLSLSGF